MDTIFGSPQKYQKKKVAYARKTTFIYIYSKQPTMWAPRTIAAPQVEITFKPLYIHSLPLPSGND